MATVVAAACTAVDWQGIVVSIIGGLIGALLIILALWSIFKKG